MRTNWKVKYDAVLIERDKAYAEISEARARISELEAANKAGGQLIDALKREVERAKLIGARDLASIMLDGGKDG